MMNDDKNAMMAAIQAMGNFKMVDDANIAPVVHAAPDQVFEAYNPSSTVDAPLTPYLPDDKSQMVDILSRLNAAANQSVDHLLVEGDTYPQLAEALVTERTSRGARIGSWEIVKNHGADFDVVHIDTGEPIAKSLRIYEAAYALASALNKGKTLTDEPVRKILALEARYAEHVGKAKHYQHMAKRLTESGKTVRAAVAEDRLDDARGKALDEHNRILHLAGLR